jgi:hypothetical protein
MFYDAYGLMDQWEDKNPALQPGGYPGPTLYGMGMDEDAAQALTGLGIPVLTDLLSPKQEYFESPEFEQQWHEDTGRIAAEDVAAAKAAALRAEQIQSALTQGGIVIASLLQQFNSAQTQQERNRLEAQYKANQAKQKELEALHRDLTRQATFKKPVTSTATWVILAATGAIILGGAFLVGKGR